MVETFAISIPNSTGRLLALSIDEKIKDISHD